MAIVGTAKEIAQTSAQVSAGGRRMRERTYRVITDSVNDGSATVLTADGLPTIGTVYGEIDIGCVCVDLLEDRISRFVWHVTAVFSTEYESITQILNEPPDLEFPSEPGEEPMIGMAAPTATYPPPEPDGSTDPKAKTYVNHLKGQGIVNSAGNIYDPPATKRISTPLVRISRNEPATAFSMARKLKYENTVNSSPWNSLTSRQAWLRLYTAQAMYFSPPTVTLARVLYWRVTYEFALKYETWDLILPDAGPFYLEYNGGTAYRKPFIGPDGPYIGLLDHSSTTQPGTKLSAGAECQYLRWRRYRETNFVELGIDLNLALTAVMPMARGFRPFPDPAKTPISTAS